MRVDLQNRQRAVALQRLQHGNRQGIITADQDRHSPRRQHLPNCAAQPVTVGRPIGGRHCQIARIHGANPLGQDRAAQIEVHMGKVGRIGRAPRPNGRRATRAVMTDRRIRSAARRAQDHHPCAAKIAKRDLRQAHKPRDLPRSEHRPQCRTACCHDQPPQRSDHARPCRHRKPPKANGRNEKGTPKGARSVTMIAKIRRPTR